MIPWSSILKTPLSLAGKLLGGLPMIFTGGWLGLLLNPYTLLLIGLMASHGWAYHKGKVHERSVNAAAVVALNKELALWRDKHEQAEAEAEGKLQAALAEWRARLQGGTQVTELCPMTEPTIRHIRKIAGD